MAQSEVTKPGSLRPPRVSLALIRWTSVLGLFGVLARYGFVLEPWAVNGLKFLVGLAAAVFAIDLFDGFGRQRQRTLRERWYEWTLLLAILLSVLFVLLGKLQWAPELGGDGLQSGSLSWTLLRAYVLLEAMLHLLRAQESLFETKLRPQTLFAGGFAALICVGTLVLLLPRASVDPDNPIGLGAALFTATSAVSVTGLVVLDTGSEFSTFGQAVILFLIQFGGLGIITFVALMALASKGSLSVPHQATLSQVSNARSFVDARQQVLFIGVIALGVEVIGALCMMSSAPSDLSGGVDRFFWSLFHSVSAFCNAGFALQADSLEGFSSNWGLGLCFMALILLGGLGTPVLRELGSLRWRRTRVGGRKLMRSLGDGRYSPRLRLQAKLALWTTALLLLIGFVGFALLEWDGVLADKPVHERILAALFQSVSPRTAGFNSVPIGECLDSTRLLLILQMVVGANPVSTGGGIKTVALAVLFLTLRSMLAGRTQVEVAGRTVPSSVVRAAISLTVIYIFVAVTLTLVLLITDPAHSTEDLAFEIVSALSTVGLSTGLTAELSEIGKFILCIAMFAGRVGPLTLAMTVVRSTASRHTYPTESVVLG